MRKLFLVCLFCTIYSASVNDSYAVTFNSFDNIIEVKNTIANDSLFDKFSNQFFIDAESIAEIGISPFAQFYMIENNKSYSIDYDITSSYDIPDIILEIDESLDNSNLSFSEPMIMRGVDVAQLTFYPIKYNAQTQTLTIIENFNIYITEEENQNNDFNASLDVPISREYEKILSNMVVNLDIGDRTTDDMPSILYVCGGSSLNNSYLQDLIQWRKEQGFKVYAVNTSETGGNDFYSVKGYISDAYYNWEYPPEYVVLVGDTGGSYQIGYSTASGGDSDYPYTLIDGDDLLPELFIGRISASSSSDLDNIINKTLAYEKATFIDFTGSDWYESSGLVGDPSATGNSAIITNEYIENIMNSFEFDNVQTCYGCSYSSWMQNRLEEGILYFNYRGYIGTSGFGSSHINNANNGYMTPFVTFITCSTGNFSSTSITESFIRAGSTTNPKGGVAAIGTATSSTHTVPNNIVDMGIYDGIFSDNIRTAGAALVSGKMALHSTYPTNPYQMTYKFTYWNNLMGDPALHLWTDTPKNLNISYPEIVNAGTDVIQLNVIDDDNNPIVDARAVLFIDDDNVFYSFTDENGDASINFNSSASSSMTLTVVKDNHIPFNDNISISSSQLIEIDEISINEEENGIANPGETIDVYFNLVNQTLGLLEDLDAHVSTNSEKIDILEGNFYIEDLPPFTSSIVGPVQLFIHNDMNALDNSELILSISDSDDESSAWSFNIELEILAPNITIENVSLNGGTLNPGQTIDLEIDFLNVGYQVLESSHINLISNTSLVDVTEPYSEVGDINLSGSASNLNPLVLELSDNIIDGSNFSLIFNISNSDGYSQNIVYGITVGTANQHDPLGPDEYGYYIYDWLDVGYSLTPFYEWIEIDPSQGGDGIDMGISDSGNGNGISNSTKYIDLPFDFTFYGEDYDEISVNANGWISFGHSNMESFRNYQLPGAGGPSPMVAAFWDDLKTSTDSKVFKYIEDDHVIIEWLNMKTYQHTDNQTFQIILYDAMTPTGDDEIKIQYKEFNNTTNGDYSQYTPYHGCYSTVGIENHLATIGLEYTFDNNYPMAASPLEDESAIFITTRNTTVLMSGDVNQDEEINVLDIVMILNHIIGVDSLDSIGQFVADMDNNEIINILDVILVINLILDF